MPTVSFSYLCEQFRAIASQSESLEYRRQQLHEYLDSFPTEEIESSLSSAIPAFFHRQWIRTSIRGHLNSAHSLSTHKIREAEFYTQHARALRWLEQARKIFETVVFFTDFDSGSLKQYHLNASQLKVGDVVLSFKTQTYLRRSLLAQIVHLSTNSPITHATIVCNTKHEEPALLTSGDITRGLGIIPPEAERGEILLVLRPQPHEALPKVESSIRTHLEWVKRRRTKNIDERRVKFPELKCQVASAIGALTIIVGCLFGKPLCLPNPFTRRPGVFCSELIDSIFTEAGILLTPRSEQPSTVGPIELLYSPHLSLIGFISNDADTLDIDQEIRGQFLSSRGAFLRGRDNFLQPTNARGAYTIPNIQPHWGVDHQVQRNVLDF